MDPYSREHLLSFYNFHLKQFGDRPEALRWTPHGQLKRYHMLADIAPARDLENATVLDYGCGTGDFYQFLKRRGITVKYTGVDINENFISLAKNKYPECTFKVMNADDDAFDGSYDYIFICGVFNLRVPGVEDDMKEALVTLFKHCNKGLALNCLSSHTPIKDPELNYTSPEEMVRFTLENLTGKSTVVYLELVHAVVDHVRLYEPAGSGYRETRTGDFLPFDSRPYRDKYFVFPLSLGPGRTTFYLICRTTTVLSLNLVLRSAPALSSYKELENLVLWIYVGLLLAMALYNLFLGIAVRDAGYLYYVAFVSFLLLYTMTLYGLSYQYLWPSRVAWENRAVSVFLHLAAVVFYQFARSFLNTRRIVPVLDKFLLLFMALHVVWLAVVFLSPPGAAEGLAVYTVAVGLALVTVTLFVDVLLASLLSVTLLFGSTVAVFDRMSTAAMHAATSAGVTALENKNGRARCRK